MLLRTEIFTRDYGNLGFLEEVIGKVARGSKLFPVGGSIQEGAHVWKNVESPLWLKTTHPWYGVESIDDDIASSFELPHHPIDVILRAGNRFERRCLSNRSRIGCALALDLASGGNDIGWTYGIADAPTGHCVCL